MVEPPGIHSVPGFLALVFHLPPLVVGIFPATTLCGPARVLRAAGWVCQGVQTKPRSSLQVTFEEMLEHQGSCEGEGSCKPRVWVEMLGRAEGV